MEDIIQFYISCLVSKARGKEGTEVKNMFGKRISNFKLTGTDVNSTEVVSVRKRHLLFQLN